jgi:hypothetical protein
MKPPEDLLKDADVVAYVVVPASAHFTGRLNLYVDGERVGRVPCLAICKPHDDPGHWLLHCDASWEPIGIQAWNSPDVAKILTIDEMISIAERYYSGLAEHWCRI